SLAALRTRLDWHPRRTAEAIALGASLAGCSAAFALSRAELGTLPMRIYWPLPLLLWTALRFGTRGTSSGLLLVALCTAWSAVRGSGPFTEASSAATMLHVQLFLTALSVPLLLVSALVEQLRRTEDYLQWRADVDTQEREAADRQTAE